MKTTLSKTLIAAAVFYSLSTTAYGQVLTTLETTEDPVQFVKPDYVNFNDMAFKTIPRGSFYMGGCVDLGFDHEPETSSMKLIASAFECAPGFTPDQLSSEYETPQLLITIDYDIQFAIFETTIKQYKDYLQQTRQRPTKGFYRTNSRYNQTLHHPITHVNHHDALNFLEWLNDTKPADDKGHYRLPSESEWEYAARGGSQTRYHWGNDIECINADFKDTSCNKEGPSQIGSYDPNDFGLYDMHGNVSEWVNDCLQISYLALPIDGSPYIEQGCSVFINRGGAWAMPAASLRSSDRKISTEHHRFDLVGIRVVRELKKDS